jgi:hypothetical protein
MKVKINNVRLAFPQLFEATTVNGEGKPAFSATFILPQNHPDIAALNSAIDKVAEEKWGPKTGDILKALRAAGKVALRNGDEKSNYSGFAGNLYVSARNAVRPTVLDANRTPLTQADGRPYAGCYVNAILDIWAQDNGYGKRINASLGGVQFYRDGDAFAGGGAASTDEFDAVDEPVSDLV